MEQKPEVGVGNHFLVHWSDFFRYPTIVTLSQPLSDLNVGQTWVKKQGLSGCLSNRFFRGLQNGGVIRHTQ